ncbi:MAG: class C beta-lactamase-related serine hydrolase [Calditrichales bacterium]|nr:MAG: class C beta-lactamase-related serine hydrolase [Calditrichales bacterium]
MKGWIKYSLYSLTAIILLILLGGGWYVSEAVPVMTGYVAKYLCSSTFISERNPAIVFTEDILPINPIARYVEWKIDYKAKKVSAELWGLFTASAVFRDDCGCTLVRGLSETEILTQGFVNHEKLVDNNPQSHNLPWPAGSGAAADAGTVGVDADKLSELLDWAFEEPQNGYQRMTRALLVIYRGQLIAERYAAGFNQDMPLLGWSMSKSVTNALAGVLVKEGLIDPYARATVPEWESPDDPRNRITFDQLIRMSSGLAFEETYEPMYDATEMLYKKADFAAFAAEKPLTSDPDQTWYYSSGTANIVARIIRQTIISSDGSYYKWMYDTLFNKIGMTSTILETDPSGTFVGSSYVFATPRDWARFGLLYLRDGVWNDTRILPEGWVRYSTTPTPKAPRGEYGAFFWLNAGQPGNPDNRLWPAAPVDAYAAWGFLEQKVIVIPSKDLVLVRFGTTPQTQGWDTNEFIRRVLALLPS